MTTTIRCVYETAPDFPARDQHPQAMRYPLSYGVFRFADCIGDAPTLGELDAFFGLDAQGLALSARKAADEAERAAAKLDASVIALVNQSRAEWVTWATTNFPSLTAPEKQRLGALFWIVSIGVRGQVRNGG